jgi:hypothetical protein
MATRFLLALCMIGISACSLRTGDFTLASSRNTGLAYTPLRKNVRGSDCSQSVLFIPWGSMNPNIQDALDDAVRQVPNGDMMINATVHYDILVTLLYNRTCMRIDGDVANSEQPGTSEVT